MSNKNNSDTCRNISTDSKFFQCSECGFVIMKFVTEKVCPLCGRDIIKENN